MAFNLSMSEFIILSLSVIALGLGIFLLVSVSKTSEDIMGTDLPTPFVEEESRQSQIENVRVIPPISQPGTNFVVLADVSRRTETQEISVDVEINGETLSLILYDDGNHFDGEAGDGTYGALFDSKSLNAGSYKIKSNGNELGEIFVHEPSCEAIVGNPSPDNINFVILPALYEDYEKFEQDALELILGKDSLAEIEPFKSNLDKLSFSLIRLSKDLECEIGCKGIDNMVCCNDVTVSYEAAQCHHDSIIVLVDSNKGCGTASFYTKVCADSKLSKQILAHELGHSFGGLADEYVYKIAFKNYEIPDSYILEFPNCDVAGCPKWADTTSDCYEGCTSADLYRPSPNSIMRYVSFGKFNEVSKKHIESQIEERIQEENELSASNKQWKSYNVNLNYKDGEVSLSPVFLLPVKSGISWVQGYFDATVYGKDGSTLYSTKVPLPLFEYPALEVSENIIFNEEVSVPLSLPFNPDAETLEITRDNETFASISLTVFSESCGDSICADPENHVSCPEDCDIAEDGFCEISVCDPDCPSQLNCLNQTQKEKSYFWPILLIVLAMALIIFVFVKARKKSK